MCWGYIGDIKENRKDNESYKNYEGLGLRDLRV